MTSITSSGLETKRSVQPWNRETSFWFLTTIIVLNGAKNWTGRSNKTKAPGWNTNLDVWHSVFVFMHGQVCLRYFNQNEDQQSQTRRFFKNRRHKPEMNSLSYRPAGLWSCPGRFQNRKPAEKLQNFNVYPLLNIIVETNRVNCSVPWCETRGSRPWSRCGQRYRGRCEGWSPSAGGRAVCPEDARIFTF